MEDVICSENVTCNVSAEAAPLAQVTAQLNAEFPRLKDRADGTVMVTITR